jgi:hypothetical protein
MCPTNHKPYSPQETEIFSLGKVWRKSVLGVMRRCEHVCDWNVRCALGFWKLYVASVSSVSELGVTCGLHFFLRKKSEAQSEFLVQVRQWNNLNSLLSSTFPCHLPYLHWSSSRGGSVLGLFTQHPRTQHPSKQVWNRMWGEGLLSSGLASLCWEASWDWLRPAPLPSAPFCGKEYFITDV